MTEMKIGISELKGEGSDLVKELADFIKDKTKAEVKTETSEIVVTGEKETVSRTYLRVLLRKFLHKKELKDFFRVIGSKENMLMIKELKVTEEE
jgi:hypothetical protein